MKLWHATTQKKAALYRKTGRICSPVRGSTTQMGAMAWAMKVGRDVMVDNQAWYSRLCGLCPNGVRPVL